VSRVNINYERFHWERFFLTHHSIEGGSAAGNSSFWLTAG